jgi:hypothetical protein
MLGHTVYLLMVVSMMMRRMVLLRLFAIASCIAGIAYSGFILTDPVSTGWETTLVIVNVGQLTLTWWLNRKAQFDEREQALREAHFATLPASRFKRLVSAGEWKRVEPGDSLATEGLPVPALSYIASGSARVLVGGRPIARCEAGSFVGEMTVSSGEPASASVVVDADTEIWTLDAKALRRLAERQTEIGRALDAAFFRTLRGRIVARNRLDSALAPA